MQLTTIRNEIKIRVMFSLSLKNEPFLFIVWERREISIKKLAIENAEGRKNKPILKKI